MYVHTNDYVNCKCLGILGMNSYVCTYVCVYVHMFMLIFLCSWLSSTAVAKTASEDSIPRAADTSYIIGDSSTMGRYGS